MALSKINSNSIADGAIVVADIADGSVTSNKLEANIAITGNLTVDSTTLTVDSVNNRVGVGTEAPGVELDVIGSGTRTIRAWSTDTSGINIGRVCASFGTGASTSLEMRAGSGYTYLLSTGASDLLLFGVGNNERMRITSTGLVGIGTTSPTTTLDVNGTITATSVNANNTFGFKNRIINGDMRIDQRNNGASVSVTNGFAFPVDRFIGVTAASTTVAFQRSTTAPSGFVNSLSCTVTTPKVLAAADVNRIIHRIEGFNTSDFAFGTSSATPITLSFWVRSSVTGTYTVTFVGGQSYMATYAINAANTWEYKTITISGSTSGSWPTDNTTGLEINFNLGAGTDWQGTAGSWINTTARFTVSGAANFIGTNGATFFLTGCQIEKGQTATSFDVFPYGTVLALCQRYCFVIRGSSEYSNAFSRYLGVGNGTNQFLWMPQYPVMMRTPPSLITSNFTSGNLDLYNYSSNAGLTFSSVSLGEGDVVHGQVTIVATSGVSAGQNCSWRWNGNRDAYIGFNSEL